VSVKTRDDLIAEIVSQITANGIQAITGPIVQSLLSDLADSGINMLGDTAILGKLGYNSLVAISNNGDIVHKKYVDDNTGHGVAFEFNSDGYITAQNWISESGDYKFRITRDNNGNEQINPI
jgi:hypothetical protein